MKIGIERVFFDSVNVKTVVLDFMNKVVVVDFVLGSGDVEVLPQRLTLDLQDLLLRRVEGKEVLGDFLVDWLKASILRVLLGSGSREDASKVTEGLPGEAK
jgi:hypothetical protein